MFIYFFTIAFCFWKSIFLFIPNGFWCFISAKFFVHTTLFFFNYRSIHALTSLFPDISQDILQLYLNDCKGDLERTVNVVLDAKKSNVKLKKQKSISLIVNIFSTQSLKTLSPKCSPAPAYLKIANDENDDDDNNNQIKKSEFSVKGNQKINHLFLLPVNIFLKKKKPRWCF